MTWRKIGKSGKITENNIHVYTAMGETYCNIACRDEQQAAVIRATILKELARYSFKEAKP